MIHRMKLWHDPFMKILEGTKTVEMRLYDEKRSAVSVGDTIVFEDTSDGAQMECAVLALHRYPSFAELYAHHDKVSIGYGGEADPAEYKRLIREHVEREYGYDLSKTVDEIRPTYRFNETCRQTVPQAIIAFLESTDFEDAIRNAISLGGDSDTLAAITGSIAEAAYGIPEKIREEALSYLDEPLLEVFGRWERFLAR